MKIPLGKNLSSGEKKINKYFKKKTHDSSIYTCASERAVSGEKDVNWKSKQILTKIHKDI